MNNQPRLQPTENTGTRDRLVGAALDLFQSQGFERTTIADVLARAEANSGSLYYYFRSKKDLLLAVLESYKTRLEPELLEPIWSTTSDPIERVFALLDGYRRALVITDCAYGCPIGKLALEIGDCDADARQLIAENFEGWKQAVRACLDAAADDFPADVDRNKLATLVLTVMEGGVMQARAYGSLDPFDTSVAMLRDYFNRLSLASQALKEPS